MRGLPAESGSDAREARAIGAAPVRILGCWPSASFSTYDVARGLFGALTAAGHHVAEYGLASRLRMTAEGLQAMAPEGKTPDPALVALHASEALLYRTVIEGCRWLLVVSGMGLHPNVLAACHRIGVKVAIVFTESPYETSEEGELRMAPVCDLAFTCERTSVAAFQAALDAAGRGGRALYLPHAHDPAIHRPAVDDDPPLTDAERSDVLLIGTGFEERQVLLEAINWQGIDLKLGGYWAGVTGYGEPHRLHRHLTWGCIDNRQTARLYRGAKIVLNPHRFAEGAESANPRFYEAAACGAFQIADERAEIGELVGDAVPTYPPGVPWRLEALIRRYLAGEPERRRLAALAKERTAAHTFAARAETVLTAIEAHDRAGRAVAA